MDRDTKAFLFVCGQRDLLEDKLQGQQAALLDAINSESPEAERLYFEWLDTTVRYARTLELLHVRPACVDCEECEGECEGHHD